MSESAAVRQTANRVPPRETLVLAQTVDATARALDLSGLAWESGGPTFSSEVRTVYLTMHAETAAVYFVFSSDSSVTITDTAAVAAGGTVAFSNTYAFRIAANDTQDFRIVLPVDRYLHVKTASGTAILRIYASSQISGN